MTVSSGAARPVDKVAVVTGGARGIGAATVARLASDGMRVIVVDIASPAAGIADHDRIEALMLDVALESTWEAVKEIIDDRYGRIDVLHHNAYTIVRNPLHDTAPADWARQLAVILDPLQLAVPRLLSSLRASRGTVLVTSSVHAHFGFPGHPAYAAAKAALGGLIRQLAVEYGPDVRFNAILPGGVRTDAWADATDDDVEAVVGRTPLRRLGDPEEIASVVSFLASNDASFITGTEIVVDGGWSIQG